MRQPGDVERSWPDDPTVIVMCLFMIECGYMCGGGGAASWCVAISPV